MCTPEAQEPQAEGVHIRQTMSEHGITVMCHSHSLWLAFLALQVHDLIPQSNLTPLPIN